MSVLSEYILSVVCTAILSGIIMLLFDKNMPVIGVLKLVFSIVMTVTILRPVLSENLFFQDGLFEMVSEDSSGIVSEGRDIAASMHREIISEQIQAYILDKAEMLNMDLSVDVKLQDDNLPESICMSGYVSPYAKKQLEQYITTQLGVRKECLTWQ